jgi:hypothetical protein
MLKISIKLLKLNHNLLKNPKISKSKAKIKMFKNRLVKEIDKFKLNK